MESKFVIPLHGAPSIITDTRRIHLMNWSNQPFWIQEVGDDWISYFLFFPISFLPFYNLLYPNTTIPYHNLKRFRYTPRHSLKNFHPQFTWSWAINMNISDWWQVCIKRVYWKKVSERYLIWETYVESKCNTFIRCVLCVCVLCPLGEYFVVGIDIEQYEASAPEKYLRGLFQKKTDKEALLAFQSYLAIVPSAPVSFSKFAILVSAFV